MISLIKVYFYQFALDLSRTSRPSVNPALDSKHRPTRLCVEEILTNSARRILTRVAIVPLVLFASGCAYFNTFYNAQSYYKEGVRLKEQKQVTAAKAKFEKSIEKSALVISRWPRSTWVDDATFLIGMGYYEMGHYPKAVRHFEQLVLAFPYSRLVPQAKLYRGLSLLKSKEYGVATVVLDEVKRNYPRLRDVAAFNLAAAFYDREDYGRAVDSLSAFVANFPTSPHVRTAVELLADACFRLGRWPEAEKWYQHSVRLLHDPIARANARLQIAAVLLEEGKHEQSARQVEEVLGRYRDLDDQANLLLGRALYELGRHEDAIATWAKVRGSSDVGAEAFFRIGKHHEQKKNFVAARAYYDTAKTRKANSNYGVQAVKRLSLLDALAKGDSTVREPAEARFLLAEIHNLNLAEYDEAMRLYQSVYDSFPESQWAPKALFAKAWILRNAKGDTAAAIPVLNQVIAEYPQTEYADEAKLWLGLPVPKRKVAQKKATKPDTLAVAPDTVRPTPSPLPSASETLAHTPSPPERLRKRPSAETTRFVPAETLPEKMPVKASPAETAKAEPTHPGALVLEIVHFDTDRWNIRDADAEVLRRNAEKLKAYPEVKVRIVGHCDPRASDAYNMTLGLKRADAVRMFLADAGVDAARLEVRSEGEHKLISTRPEEYWLDRRVEFELID